MNPVSALIVVDVQNDFIEGTLALKDCGHGEDGVDVVEPINRLVKEDCWKKVVYSLDWHPETHIGFYENLHLREVHPDSNVRFTDGAHYIPIGQNQFLWFKKEKEKITKYLSDNVFILDGG